jgi:hypothetical protein
MGYHSFIALLATAATNAPVLARVAVAVLLIAADCKGATTAIGRLAMAQAAKEPATGPTAVNPGTARMAGPATTNSAAPARGANRNDIYRMLL